MENSSVAEAYNSPFAIILRGLLAESPKTSKKTTKKMLAGHLGVKQQSVSSWANGTTLPDTKHIAPIAKFFGVSCDYLLGLSGDVKTTDPDIQALCEKLKFSEEGVYALIRLQRIWSAGFPDTLNKVADRLVQHDRFAMFMSSIEYLAGITAHLLNNPDYDFDVFNEHISALADGREPSKAFKLTSTALKKAYRLECQELALGIITDIANAMAKEAVNGKHPQD